MSREQKIRLPAPDSAQVKLASAGPLAARLAVCSWSLQPSSLEDLAEKLAATGLTRLQLALDPLLQNPAAWGRTPEFLRERGFEVVSGMFGCVGEDYTSLESIRLTGGVAPDATWERNLRNIKATAELASRMGLKLVTFHAGFLPHDEADPDFQKMLGRLREIADLFTQRGIALGLETGQETAAILVGLLRKLDRPNVRVNFDPANMILYGKGDPIEALRLLGPWICQVHIKDATRTRTPGTWGAEVPAGTGEVDWKAFFDTLKRFNYNGNLVIEREAGDQRVADIRQARRVIENAASR